MGFAPTEVAAPRGAKAQLNDAERHAATGRQEFLAFLCRLR